MLYRKTDDTHRALSCFLLLTFSFCSVGGGFDKAKKKKKQRKERKIQTGEKRERESRETLIKCCFWSFREEALDEGTWDGCCLIKIFSSLVADKDVKFQGNTYSSFGVLCWCCFDCFHCSFRSVTLDNSRLLRLTRVRCFEHHPMLLIASRRPVKY